MKNFLVSIIAISVATGAMAASTLVSAGDSKSTPSATYRAGSLRANKRVTENVALTSGPKNQELGRVGTIGTKKITVSSNKNTGGTTGGTQTGGSSSNNTGNNNAGAITNAAFQEQLNAFSVRIDNAYDAAFSAADSIVSTQNVINSMRNDLDEIKTTITNLRGDSSVNITELVSRIETLQGTLNGLQNNLNTLSTNAVALNTFTERVNTLNQKIEAVKSTAEQLNSAGYLTSASIFDLTSRVDNAIATIGTMQETLATKAEITNMATVLDVATAKQEAMRYTDEAKAVANVYTDNKVNDMATRTFVNESIGFDGTVKQYVDAKVGTNDSVSAKDYIDAKIAEKVGDTGSYASASAYTDAKTNGMATKTFVNNRIGLDEESGRTIGSSNVPTVKEYVDAKDGGTRAWVNDNVVGPIQNATVKAYIDGKFEEAADPENPDGWGSHFKQVNDGLLTLGNEYRSGKEQNDENNENNASRITALEQGQEQTNENLRAETERLDGLITANTNKIDQKMNVADFANNLAANSAFQTLQTNLDAAATKADLQQAQNTLQSAIDQRVTIATVQEKYAEKTTVNALSSSVDTLSSSVGTLSSNVGTLSSSVDSLSSAVATKVSSADLGSAVVNLLDSTAFSAVIANTVAGMLTVDTSTGAVGLTSAASSNLASSPYAK